MLVLLLNILALAVSVFSTRLTVLQPLDGQLPLVARVNKPYSWSFSNHTFSAAIGTLSYSTSALPEWLSFDGEKLTFFGTPSPEDEGDTEITVTAKDSYSTVSSAFNLCVTTVSEPTVSLAIQDQFRLPQSSISSVFALEANSALATQYPALRIPPRWSFSIGFQYETCQSDGQLFYDVRLRDGSDLPGWIFFNEKAITVNGVVPNENHISQPTVLPLFLACSDQEGYTALSLPFDIIIAANELSTCTSSLPPINVTAATPFSISLFSTDDYSGVLVDGESIQPHEVLDLRIDTSQYAGWLKYDQTTRTLSGDPANGSIALGTSSPMPVTLTSIFNQSIQTLVSLRVVASCFSSSDLPTLEGTRGDLIQFNLVQYLSSGTSPDEIRLTASFEPLGVAQYLKFDQKTAQLMGTIPPNLPDSRITVTFTAYSIITHSTSHTHLPILLSPSGHTENGIDAHSGGRFATSHARLVLGLSITFGVLGGLCLIVGLLAIFRHWARVPDTAVGGEEGRNVWSEQDQRWYNLGVQKVHDEDGWAENTNYHEKSGPGPGDGVSREPDYTALGLGLRRVSERSQSGTGSPHSHPQSPGVMSKREFITKIKRTVRAVSDRARHNKSPRQRPMISRPVLLSQHSRVPLDHGTPFATDASSLELDGPGLQSHPGSTIMSNSPSTSTGEQSIPRRRPDFEPPKTPAPVHFQGNRLSRQTSSGSTGSSVSSASTRAHAAEAVVRTVSKVLGFRSGVNSTVLSLAEGPPPPAIVTRPKLVPFTSESRVPVPHRPVSPPGLSNDFQGGPHRVNSQTAKVWKGQKIAGGQDVLKSRSGDELSMGIHYVRSLGADTDAVRTEGPDSARPPPAEEVPSNHMKDIKMLVRSGEKFRFRVPLSPTPIDLSRSKFDVRLVSGKPLPKFLRVDDGPKGPIELYGTPGSADIGKFVIGVYDAYGSCLKSVTIEVVKWR